MADDPVALMDKLNDFRTDIFNRLHWQFPWFADLNDDERHAFLVDLLQALHTRQPRQLQTVVEEWQATAEAIKNPSFMAAWRESDNADDYVPWEQVRGDPSLPSDAEEGRR